MASVQTQPVSTTDDGSSGTETMPSGMLGTVQDFFLSPMGAVAGVVALGGIGLLVYGGVL